MAAVRRPPPRWRALALLGAFALLALALLLALACPALAQNLETEASQGFNRVADFIRLMRRGALIAALVVLVVVVYSAYFTGRFNTRLLLVVFAGLVVLSVGGMGIEYLIDDDELVGIHADTGRVLLEGGFRDP